MRSFARKLLWAVLLSYACTACSQHLAASGINDEAAKDIKQQGKAPLDTHVGQGHKAPEHRAQQAATSSAKSHSVAAGGRQGRLAGAEVSGFLFRQEPGLKGNRYNPTAGRTAIPAGAGNRAGSSEVAVKDTWTEFAADHGDSQVESLDITPAGLITLQVDSPKASANGTFTGAEYILESDAFKQFGRVSLVSSTLPADVAVSVSGAADLAAGEFNLNIPSFSDPAANGGVAFRLQYRLEGCRPGRGAKCCSSDGQVLPSGTVCRRAASVCQKDQTCNGVDPSCPVNAKADGTECAYDPLEFWRTKKSRTPHSTATEAQMLHTSGGDGDHGRPPACIGKCDTGKCVLDKSRSGCCSVQGPEQEDADVYSTQAAGSGSQQTGPAGLSGATDVGGSGREASPAQQAGLNSKGIRDGVYCWKGVEDYGY